MSEKEPLFSVGPWQVKSTPPEKEDSYDFVCVSDGKGYTVASMTDSEQSSVEIDKANARLISVSPEMYYLLKRLLDECAPDEHRNTRYPSENLLNAAKAVLARARGEEDKMTDEQIKVCREYISVIEMIREANRLDFFERPSSDVLMTGSFEEIRRRAHYALLDVYGFNYESDTWDITGDIPEGMTPRELHDKLMDLKRMMEAKHGKK